MKRHLLLLVVACFAMVVFPRAASAQFDTPNRSFHNSTAFRLDGKHQAVACESCHLNGQYKGTPSTCYDCHWIRRKDDRFQTRLGAQCEQCHRPTSWTAVQWNHAAQSGVPLNQDHQQIACESCHRGAVFTSVSVTCVNCHQKDYSATTAPNHAAAGFPTSCDSCHRPSESTWRNTGTGGFSHAAVFPLVGTHATQACVACHKNNVYKGTPSDCVGCHLADYNRTQTPNHAAAGFPLSCDACHRATDAAFKGSGAATSFNHNSIFALVGTHGSQACVACHKNNVYKGTPRDCVGCHLAQYNATRNPSHTAAGFGTTCETCHRPTDAQWPGATFNHGSVFALVGKHATTACATCHKNNVYKGTPRDCFGCHQTEYNATKNPPHASAGFGTTCDSCHRPTDAQWPGASFNHSTVFALVGKHATTACATCHKNNVYKGTPRDCFGCHQTEYNATKNPPHASAGFGTTCDSCHRPTDAQWTGATFNHSTVFALVGTHATLACASCHINNVYKGTARTCVGCHLAKYNATTNPKHSTAGFGTTCETCHRATDSSWQQGTFTHTRFPLTGRHNVACAQCHTTPNNYAVFSCTVCHARSETDNQHRNRKGYVYDSNACYSCHPNGRAG